MHLPEDMDHNTFDSEEDLYKPFQKFLKEIVNDRAELHPEELVPFILYFEEQFYKAPKIALALEKKQAELAQQRR